MKPLRDTEIQEYEQAVDKVQRLLSNEKSLKCRLASRYVTTVVVDLLTSKKIYRERLKANAPGTITKEEVQKRRNEVLEMVRNKSPLSNIKKFRGKNIDGDPIKFFEDQYCRYIQGDNNVIFSIDLKTIDPELLTALRNTAARGGNMPIGNNSDKTNAIFEGKFTDGIKSEMSASLAKAMRAQRLKKSGKSKI